MKRKFEVFEYGSNLNPIDDNSYSSSHFLQFSISGSGSELSSVSSTHPYPSNSMDSVSSNSMDSVSNASLPIRIEEDSHPFLDPDEILDAISLSAGESLQKLLEERSIPIPLNWTSSELAAEVIGVGGQSPCPFLLNVESGLSYALEMLDELHLYQSSSFFFEAAYDLILLIA